jgi:hypothetical protein
MQDIPDLLETLRRSPKILFQSTKNGKHKEICGDAGRLCNL